MDLLENLETELEALGPSHEFSLFSFGQIRPYVSSLYYALKYL